MQQLYDRCICTLLALFIKCIIYTSHTFPVVILISPQLMSIFPRSSYALHRGVVADWLRKLTDWPVSPRFDMMTRNEWITVDIKVGGITDEFMRGHTDVSPAVHVPAKLD